MINYRILPEQKLIVICNWGRTTKEDVMKMSLDLRNDTDFSQTYDAILDNSQLEWNFSRNDIEQLATPRIDTDKPIGKIAIIAPADITFGMSRMHELMSEQQSPHKIYVARDSGAALQWLGRDGFDIESVFEALRTERMS